MTKTTKVTINATVYSINVEDKQFKTEDQKDWTKCPTKSSFFLGLYDLGMNVSEIAKLTDSHYSFVHGVISTKREMRTTEKSGKSDLFRELTDQGKTPGEIAKITNSNYSFVFGVVKKYKESKEAK